MDKAKGSKLELLDLAQQTKLMELTEIKQCSLLSRLLPNQIKYIVCTPYFKDLGEIVHLTNPPPTQKKQKKKQKHYIFKQVFSRDSAFIRFQTL